MREEDRRRGRRGASAEREKQVKGTRKGRERCVSVRGRESQCPSSEYLLPLRLARAPFAHSSTELGLMYSV